MEILIIFLLILLNGVFAMSEIAMVSSRKARLEAAAKRGDKGSAKALEMSKNPGRFLSTVQIGITLIGILTGIYSGAQLEDDFTAWLNTFPSLQPFSQTIAVTVIVVSLTFFSLVLGELVPKRIGLTMPEKISRTLAIPMNGLSKLTSPFIWLLTITSDLLIRLLRIKATSESRITEEEIKAIIQEGTEEGAIEEIEQDIVERVFSLGDRTVASLMTHRNDLVYLRTDDDAEAVRKTVNEEMHSVYPVMNEEMDVVGIILLKDLFRCIDEPVFRLADHIRKPQYVTEIISAYEALKLFKTGKTHQALVIDEFGQTQGLVTMNDLLEALVGDVSEFYESEFSFIQREDGSWLIDGQYPLADFLRRFDLDEMIENYPYNTISGLILHELRSIPSAGEHLDWMNFRIEVMDMDGARIDKILLSRREENDD
ncbi:MAG: hemolysin family protein [Bacteroidia bacterium]